MGHPNPSLSCPNFFLLLVKGTCFFFSYLPSALSFKHKSSKGAKHQDWTFQPSKSTKPTSILLMEEILHQLIGSLSQYFTGFYTSKRWFSRKINTITGCRQQYHWMENGDLGMLTCHWGFHPFSSTCGWTLPRWLRCADLSWWCSPAWVTMGFAAGRQGADAVCLRQISRQRHGGRRMRNENPISGAEMKRVGRGNGKSATWWWRSVFSEHGNLLS